MLTKKEIKRQLKEIEVYKETFSGRPEDYRLPANFHGQDLRKVGDLFVQSNLTYIDFSDAVFSGLMLDYANFYKANLSGAALDNTSCRNTDFRQTNLSNAALTKAKLIEADLPYANLEMATLAGANLSGANLEGSNLKNANLSGAKGLLDPSAWMAKHFTTDKQGVLVYKRIGSTDYKRPRRWIIRPGSVLTEVANPDRTCTCSCGVNFGTREFCIDRYTNADLWLCHIRWEWLPGVVVPYNTDGKARCSKLELLELVKE